MPMEEIIVPRLMCPMCGNTNTKHMEELDDRKKPLFYFKNGTKPMYAKKILCTDCRYEWSK